MVDVNQWNVSRSNQKIEEAVLNVVSASGLFFIIFFLIPINKYKCAKLLPKTF